MMRKLLLGLLLLWCAPALASQPPGLHVLRNFKAGFALSLDPSTPNTVVDVGPGQVADSTNSTLITGASSLTVNLGTTGAGGLDTGTVAANTWYALYAISGNSGTSVIASAPAVISTTGAISSGSSTLGTASAANITAGSSITVQGAGQSGANLNTSVSAVVSVSVSPTGTTANSSNSITLVSSLTSVIPGLAISDSDACIQAGTVIAAASGSTITLSQSTKSTGCAAGDTLTISGANVTLATTANATVGETAGTTVNLTVPVWGVSSISGRTPMSLLLPSGYAYYRYIGSVKTDGASHIMPFAQKGDWFFWMSTPTDYSGFTVTSNPTVLTLSVPLGVNVQPLIRASINNSYVSVVSPDEARSQGAYDASGTYQGVYAYPTLLSNVAGQVEFIVGSSGGVNVITRGWIENWGRGN